MADDTTKDSWFGAEGETPTISSINGVLSIIDIPERDLISKLISFFSSDGGSFDSDVKAEPTVAMRISTVKGLNKFTFINHLGSLMRNRGTEMVRLYEKIFDEAISTTVGRSDNQIQAAIIEAIRKYCWERFAEIHDGKTNSAEVTSEQ